MADLFYEWKKKPKKPFSITKIHTHTHTHIIITPKAKQSKQNKTHTYIIMVKKRKDIVHLIIWLFYRMNGLRNVQDKTKSKHLHIYLHIHSIYCHQFKWEKKNIVSMDAFAN